MVKCCLLFNFMAMNSLRPKIHLRKPCTENWEAMLPAEQGRFCLHCQKTVIDFTQKSEAEILTFLANAGGSTCGRVYEDQVWLPQQERQPLLSRWKAIGLAAFLTVSAHLTILTASLAQTVAYTFKAPTSQSVANSKEDPILSDAKLHLKGVVLDAVTEKPVPKTRIYLQGNQENPPVKNFDDGSVVKSSYGSYGAVTDEEGRFEIEIPLVELGSFKQQLQFQAEGYFVQKINLDAINNRQPLVQYLSKVENTFPSEREERLIRMGGMAPSESLITRWRGKPYRSRAGILLARATMPVRRLKEHFQDRYWY